MFFSYGHFSVKTTRQTTLHTAFKVVVEVVIKANMCGWRCCWSGNSLSDCVVVGIDSFRFSDSVTNWETLIMTLRVCSWSYHWRLFELLKKFWSPYFNKVQVSSALAVNFCKITKSTFLELFTTKWALQ